MLQGENCINICYENYSKYLLALSANCEFTDLTVSRIRDRIVLGTKSDLHTLEATY